MVAVAGRRLKTMRLSNLANKQNRNPKAKVENPNKVQTQLVNIKQNGNQNSVVGAHENRLNQEDRLNKRWKV